MAVNGAAAGDDHVTRSRRPKLQDLRTFRSAPDVPADRAYLTFGAIRLSRVPLQLVIIPRCG
jgi:hypothetical protein